MWAISDVRKKGKEAFKKNYWRCVLAALILTLLTAGSSLSGSSGSTGSMKDAAAQIGSEELEALVALFATFFFVYVIVWSLLRVFLLNILEVGCHTFLKKNINGPATLEDFKAGFADYKKTMLTMLLRDVFLALWFCLLFVPGIIKSYSYMMVPYILTDEPGLKPMEAIKRSCEMMKGHKWRTFLLDLSFIGWIILSMLTCNVVGVLYTEPYRRSARAALYHELSRAEA